MNWVNIVTQQTEVPAEIGGYMVPESWNDATWYNSALDGVMSDWKVVVE